MLLLLLLLLLLLQQPHCSVRRNMVLLLPLQAAQQLLHQHCKLSTVQLLVRPSHACKHGINGALRHIVNACHPQHLVHACCHFRPLDAAAAVLVKHAEALHNERLHL
ncbi:hypothetical protein COO60DRAFT_1535010 [Scenedesmus sp. NREL 46B-D3]|nr:hypothetical protein COO60DRAFT_1535010 [Scenedesmus sp. NREL 46B-D3]